MGQSAAQSRDDYGTRIENLDHKYFTEEILLKGFFWNVLFIQLKYLPEKETSIRRLWMLGKYWINSVQSSQKTYPLLVTKYKFNPTNILGDFHLS